MAGNSVAANLLMLVLLVGGLALCFKSKQEVFPEFTENEISITMNYPGGSPEEVEKGIILPIEEAVQGVEGIDEIRSNASEGSASITIEALESVDIIKFWQEIETEVDKISSFPDEADDLRVSIADRKRGVIDLILYGSENDFILRDYGEKIKNRLLKNKYITQAEVTGARDREIHIEIPKENLRKFNISIDEIASLIKKSSIEVGAGNIESRGGDILVRVKNLREKAEEYKNIPVISMDNGARVLLGDIALIKEGFEKTTKKAEFNGKNAIMISVYRVGDQTPVDIAGATKSIMAEVNQELPGDLSLSILKDRSKVFIQRADLLMKNAFIGLALVFVLLAVFLEIRLAFWVSLGIPISFMGAFTLFPFTDFTINMVTMFAFIVTLGIVVDDAIVVGENIYHRKKDGEPFLNSAIAGVKEVAMPVVFSVITNIVAFMPLYFVPGIIGKIFKVIPVVVASVFFISLVESLFILPSHLAHQKKGKGLKFFNNHEKRFNKNFTSFLHNYFSPFLSKCLEMRYMIIASAIAVLFATAGYVKSGRLGMELFPVVESDFAFVSATLPTGASDESAARVEKILINSAKKVISENGNSKLSTGIFSLIRENNVSVRAYLTEADVRPLSTSEFSKKWRKETGFISGIETMVFQSDRGGPGSGKGLTIRLSHQNTDILEQAGKDLASKLLAYNGVSDVDDGSAKGKKQMDISILPAGERMGLTSREISNQLRNALYGKKALTFLRGRDEIDVMVKFPKSQSSYESTLENLVLKSPSGEILLRDAAEITYSRAFTSIKREDGMRVNSVTANITPRSKAEILLKDLEAEVFPDLMEKYPSLSYDYRGRQSDIRESITSLRNGLLISILIIYAILAIPFQSYFQPLIIMLSIPFGIVGAVAGHLIMNYSLSIMSLFGIVALSGVVVNDSLVLIDFTNKKHKNGKTAVDSIKEAASQRFRPIILTTLTTFFGLMPMILETSRQAKFMIPMAISLGFGVLFATFITLVIVPCFYMVVDDVKKLSGF